MRSSAAAALVVLLVTLFVTGRGPGSLTWMRDRAPTWLPFAGSGVDWLPIHAPWLPFIGSGADPHGRAHVSGSPHPGPKPSSPQSRPPVPALAPSPRAGETPTPAPTVHPRPSPTPTPVPTRTPTPTPSLTPNPMLFYDSFESDPLGLPPAGWRSLGDLYVAMDGNHVLRTEQPVWALATVGQGSWTSYTVSARVKAASTTGHSRLVARFQGPNAYYGCGLDHGGFLYLGEVDALGWSTLNVASYAFEPDHFYEARFTVQGTVLTCAVSDPTGRLPSLTITASDSAYARGAAGWVGEGPGEVDSFKVTSG